MDSRNALVSTGDEREERKKEGQLNVSLIKLKDKTKKIKAKHEAGKTKRSHGIFSKPKISTQMHRKDGHFIFEATVICFSRCRVCSYLN